MNHTKPIITLTLVSGMVISQYGYLSTGQDMPSMSVSAAAATANSSAQAVVYKTISDEPISIVAPVRDEKTEG